MQIPLFNGGLSTRLDPSLIQVNEAVEYSNIDNSRGILKSSKSYTQDEREAYGFFYIFNDVVISSDTDRDYLEHAGKLYWTAPNEPAQKYNGGNLFNLGIAAPVPKPAFDSNGEPIFDSSYSQVQGLYVQVEDFVDTDFYEDDRELEGQLSAGTYQYRIFIYEDGKLIHYIDKSITVGSNAQVAIDLKTNHLAKLGKLDGGSYKLIHESSSGLLIDNGQAVGAVVPNVITTDDYTAQWTYTYYNSVDGTESAPAPLTNEIMWQLDKKVKLSNFTISDDPQVDMIRVYRVNDGITLPALTLEIPNVEDEYYDYTPTLALTTVLDTFDNIPPIEGIRYLTEAYGLFFAANGTKLVWSQVGNANYWPVANSLDFGFVITGILPIYTGILVMGLTKTDLLSGTSSETFARESVSKTQGCRSHKSCKLINYFPCWVGLDGICTISNGAIEVISRDKLGDLDLNIVDTAVLHDTYWILTNDHTILAMDNRFGSLVFKRHYMNQVLSDIVQYDNKLYSSINNKLVELFTGKDLKFYYLSPKFSEGISSMTKLYNNIYIKYKGDFILSIFVDDKLAVDKKQLDKDKILADVKVPEEFQRGCTIQFAIEGIGEVNEIEYKPVERQNGR